MIEKKKFPVHLFFKFNPVTKSLDYNEKCTPVVRQSVKLRKQKNYYKGSEWEYWQIGISSSNFKKEAVAGHKVAWFLHHGEWPSGVINFIDGNGLNLSADNMRDVTWKEVSENKSKYHSNKSGITGVMWDKERKKWRVQIRGKKVGRFDDFFEACCARFSAQNKDGAFSTRHGK